MPDQNTQKPVIILVRPQLGENIGATARAMKNFGLDDLRIVAPRDGWPNPKAHEMAAHADHIIEQATLYDTLPDALHDCHIALASSARRRDMELPSYTPRSAAQYMTKALPARTAFVFGQENNGLSNEDISHCHAIVTIPTDAYSSLNLAQSVVVLAYEYFTQDLPEQINHSTKQPTLSEVQGIYDDITERLEGTGYYPEGKRGTIMRQHFKQTLLQSQLTSAQIRSLRGMARALQGNHNENSSQNY